MTDWIDLNALVAVAKTEKIELGGKEPAAETAPTLHELFHIFDRASDATVDVGGEG